MKKHKKALIALTIIMVTLVSVFAAFAIYAGSYYHASERAVEAAVTDAEAYTIETLGDYLVFRPNDPMAGLIFYPGGKVEYTAYAPLMTEFAKQGVLCVLVKMPFNLAVFDVNAADSVREVYREPARWYIGGHSLGGAMAAAYLEKHTEEYEGLLLLAAYSTEDFSDTNLNVISLYGTEDRVLQSEKYESYRGNLPEGFAEQVIDGGCHSYFGDYGMQKGDGTPTISRQEQFEITAEYFAARLDG